MKTLFAALIAAVFAFGSAFAVASPVTGIVAQASNDDEKKSEDAEKKEEQKASTADGDERENTEEKKSD